MSAGPPSTPSGGDPRVGYSERPRWTDVRPWALLLAPPTAYLLVLALRYGLTSPACGGGAARVLLEGAGALGLIATAAPGVLAWRRAGEASAEESSDGPGPDGSHALLLELAVFSSVLFALVALATWIPSWFLDPCGP